MVCMDDFPLAAADLPLATQFAAWAMAMKASATAAGGAGHFHNHGCEPYQKCTTMVDYRA